MAVSKTAGRGSIPWSPAPRRVAPTGSPLALRRLDEDELPAVEQLRDRAGLLDLAGRVADGVVKGLDVHAGDLHARRMPRLPRPYTRIDRWHERDPRSSPRACS